ncbi:MAG: hypothetical protein FWC79_03275 [Oscillospiraceae bacterium]|nr:hypothetical protein [Oscillospiraceae bacterium]
MEELMLAKENMTVSEELLSEFACKTENAILINETQEKEDDFRADFFRDIDKIIHSTRIYKIYGQNASIFI